MSFVFLLACEEGSNNAPSSASAAEEVPYHIYEYKDCSGCEYIVFHSRSGQGTGLAAVAKAHQLSSICKK